MNSKNILRAAVALALLILTGFAQASTDYGPAIWNQAYSGHWYTSGYGHKFFVVHDIEGYYLSCISMFKQSSAGGSVHYVANGKKDTTSDAPAGEITQMVRDAYYAWHARCWNQHSMGTEHEGFASNPAWFTEEMYQASAALTRSKAEKYGFAKDRNHVIAHGQKSVAGWPGYASANLGIDPYCNDHTDPGPYWNWSHYMSLINGGSMVGGAILVRYNQLGGQNGILGAPITYELTCPDGVGKYNHFQNGSIYWTPSTGAWEIYGAIRDKWSSLGWERSQLGYPTTGENGTPDGVGRYNHFQNGSIYFSPSTGAHEVRGSIHAKWQESGWENGVCGYPLTDESGCPDGVGRYNHFSKGTSIYFSPSTGAHIVTGGIRAKWEELGWEGGVCGYPTTDESPCPDGVGRYNHFSKNCSIYWSPSTGAHQVGGAIRDRWISLGWEQSWLGYPTSDEYAVTGARRSDFQNGYILCDTTTGAITMGPLPNAPTALSAATFSNTQINLAWTDNANNELGFKVERATAAGGPFSQIGTAAANATTYASTSLTPGTTYYYRVCAYNNAGNSAYTATASATTTITPPAMSAIANQTIAANGTLTFSVTSTDPNKSVSTTTFQDFESFTNNTPNDTVMFRRPANSGSTSAFVDTAQTNYTSVRTSFPAGHSSAKVLQAGWSFKTGQTNPWIRLNTANPTYVANPCIEGAQVLRFDLYTTKALKVGLGFRETGTTVAYGANGGTAGTIDWAGVTNATGGIPLAAYYVNSNTWTTLNINIPFAAQAAYTGDGVVAQAKGVLEHLVLGAVNNAGGAYTVYLDNFAVVASNTLTFSLDAGAPAGATIDPRTGKFSWVPTPSQAGVWTIIARVTDQLGAQDSKSFKVTVTSTGNSQPVMAAIGNKTVNELSALTFTATASDPDPGQTLTFSLDAGVPAGASITTGGSFSWTPTEAQGPGSYPITVRVTDNGSPSSNDWQTITVTVNEVNVVPAISAISNRTVNEADTVSFSVAATDSDSPANTLTYSLSTDAPSGASINPSTGAFSWTPTEAQGPSTNPITVIVRDNGSPSLAATNSFTVTVNEVNTAPVLTVGNVKTTIDTVTDFESFEDGSYNGTVMFRQPAFSSATSGFIDGAVTNLTTAQSSYPVGHTSLRALYATWAFKTGTTNPWVRLTTYNTTALPNPAIKLDQRVRFDIYTDKTLGLALGVRETGTSAIVGQNGGSTGPIEFVGASGVVNGCPTPTRTVQAGSWTTLEFNLPAEQIVGYPSSGNGVLATGKGVLEHLAMVPMGGMGTYNVYLDNFQVVTVTTNLTIDTGETITVTNTASDVDVPAQNLTFSLDAGAPAGASIDQSTGVLTWTPASSQAPSTNVITVRVTDNGPGNLSDTKSVTVVVNKVNTAPQLTGAPDQAVELQGGSTITLNFTATDNDVPTNTLTFSLQGAPPSGASINPSTGVFTWTPPNVLSSNVITVRVTDNGVPALYDEKDIVIVVTPANASPVLSLGAARVVEKMVNFESFTNNTPNGNIMFRRPNYSSSTSAFLDSSTNYTTVTTSFPAGNANAGSKVLKAGFGFSTSAVNPWMRLTTAATVSVLNPTIDLTARVKFDIYVDKSMKVALGVRETGTTAAIGADGGTTGGIEWLGATKNGTSPVPSRTINAGAWTTVEFNLPAEYCTNFVSGNSVLAAGKGVLEHLALVPNAGTGAYTVYLDNFEVVWTPTVPGTVTMNANSTLTFTASATDPDPGSGISYGLDADAPTGSVITQSTGAFSWTPASAGTFNVTVYANDNPTNGAIIKTDSESVTVVVSSDPLGVQSAPMSDVVRSGESVVLTWVSVPGAVYQLQKQTEVDGKWVNVGDPVTADSIQSSVELLEADQESIVRIIDLGPTADQ